MTSGRRFFWSPKTSIEHIKQTIGGSTISHEEMEKLKQEQKTDIEKGAAEASRQHLRLIGLFQEIGMHPTGIHIGIEKGGTLLSDDGEELWNGAISAESFEDTMIDYLESMPESIDQTIEYVRQKLQEKRDKVAGWNKKARAAVDTATCPDCGHKLHTGVSCLESDCCGCGE
jgi:hypothetical protein